MNLVFSALRGGIYFMKISFKNVSDLRLKVVICAFVFVLGLFLSYCS